MSNFGGRVIGLFIAIGVLALVLMLVIPLPAIVLDILMVMNMAISLSILLIVVRNAKKTADFSILPTVLLVVSVFGLALNVSTTRLILTKGANFDGRIIRVFSTFIIGSGDAGRLVVGFAIFITIVVIQVLVITKRVSRITEVAARFSLDALPGKQMIIEAKHNSGAITEEESYYQKRNLQKEVDFYGAMGGSSKFIAGYIKVNILITALNILGGITIGITLRGEPTNSAVETYIPLSIGAGLLITYFPVLLLSIAIGIIITRSVPNISLGKDGLC